MLWDEICVSVNEGVSINEAAGVVDSWPGAACRPVWEVGNHCSSTNDLLAFGVHIPNRLPHRCAPDIRQTEHGLSSDLITIRYDTIEEFNVDSKADGGKLNLAHEPERKKYKRRN